VPVPALSYAVIITHLALTSAEYEAFVRSPFVDELIAGEEGVSAIVILDSPTAITPPGSLPLVVCALGGEFGGVGPAHADVVFGAGDVDAALATIGRSPIAAVALSVLLRMSTFLPVDSGLAAESATYSLLQAGPEFASWRTRTPAKGAAPRESVVRVERCEGRLDIILDRADRHNAVSRQLRDELATALQIAVADDSITSVCLRGEGPSFCSGGDLAEFGERVDVATAHITRLARSPGRTIARLASRLTAEIHGATMGGGIEMAAFAGRVVAHPDTRIALPEIDLGLIPGAGGTVSMPRRIGRQRTAALGLTGRVIDAPTALAWGLIDEITEVGYSAHGNGALLI